MFNCNFLWMSFFVVVSAEFDVEKQFFCSSPPPKLVHGLIERDRVSFYTGQGYIGSMEYICAPGFNRVGNKKVTCQNGKWSPMPQCLPKKRCKPINLFPNNAVIKSENLLLFHNDPQEILVGSTMTFECVENHVFENTSNTTLTIHCQNDGSWTPVIHCHLAMDATCDYSKLYLPARSRITRMNFQFSESNRQYHQVGSYLEYTCEDGYRLHDGQTSLIVQCLNTGSWSPLPVCEYVYEATPSIRCPYPIYINNGFIAVYNVTIWEDQTYTGQVIYECNYGFESPTGHDQIVSDCINGTWSNSVDCQEIPTCPKQELLEIEAQAENSYVNNVSLQYIRDPMAFVYDSYVLRVCLPNFEHDPSSPPLKIQCQRSTNTWTGIPICRSLHSDPPSTTTTTSTTTTIAVVSTTTTTTSTTTTTTQMMIACHSEDIPSIPNATIIIEESNDTFPVGTRLNYTCLSGIESMPSFTICLIDGNWSTENVDTTSCQSNETAMIDVPEVDETSIMSTSTEIDESTVDYNQSLSTMSFSVEDISSTVRSVAAGDRQARQISVACEKFPTIEHAQLLKDETRKSRLNNKTLYQGSVTFQCQYGFFSEMFQDQPVQITCQHGEFYPILECLEKPRCPLPPPIDLVRSNVINSQINVFDTSTNEAIPGSFILIRCSENSTFNVSCLEHGQWSLPPPSCTPAYKRRCQSGITIPNARTQIHAKLTADGHFNDGSRAIYRCLDNFVHDQQSGPLYLQCQKGRWGPRPKCIPEGCLQPLPDEIDHGWKSAESYFIYQDTKYYLLTRYSCHKDAKLVDSSSTVIDIECRKNEWQHKILPKCQFVQEIHP